MAGLGAALTALFALPASAAEQAGVAAAVRGQVQIAERTGAVGRQVASGQPVFLGNAITSGPNSGLQIILLDETTFTIGPNSQIAIDEFVYDPRSGGGKVTASVAKGVFRFVTGKVARNDPAAMQVNLPTGTIGIRGTIGLGRVDQTAQNGASTDRQQVVLMGPGPDTEGNNPGGLSLNAGGLQVLLTRLGFGSTLLGGGPWGPATRFDAALIAEMLAAIQAAFVQVGQRDQAPSGNATQNSGGSSTDIGRTANTLYNLNGQLTFAQLTQNEESAFGRDATNKLGGMPVSGQQTTYEQLRAQSGQGNWTQTNVPLTGVTNTYSLFLNVDFGRRSVGGGNSRVTINPGTITGGNVALAAQSYSSLSGPAQFTFNNNASISDGTNCGGFCRFKLVGTPYNTNNVTAGTLQHALTIRNSADTATVATGSGTAPLGSGLVQ